MGAYAQADQLTAPAAVQTRQKNDGGQPGALAQLRQDLADSPRGVHQAVLQRALNPTSAFARATQGAATAVPYQAAMEQSFGQSFAGVQAYLGQSRPMASLGAQAAAHGEQVAFASPSPSREVVAHELAHVAQQRQVGGGGVAALGGLSHPNSAAEREADAVSHQAAANQPVTVSAAPDSGLHLVRYQPGQTVLIDGGKKQGTIQGLAMDNEMDDLCKYNVLIQGSGKTEKISGARLALVGGQEPELVEEEKQQEPVIEDPRFAQEYDKLKLDLALKTSLQHVAEAAVKGNIGNLRGKLAEMMAQQALMEKYVGMRVLQDIKVGQSSEEYGVTELADIDHALAEEVGGEDEEKLLRLRALVETKSGKETPDEVLRLLKKKLQQLPKVGKGQADIFGMQPNGKPDPNQVETDMYHPDSFTDKGLNLLTAGPKRGPKESKFDIELPFTADEMIQFTQYVAARYQAMK